MVAVIFQWISNFILFVIAKIGYGGIFLLMTLESANIPIPSEIIMPFSGFLASRGSFNFWLVVFWGAIGNLAGSLISYKLAHLASRNGFLERYRILKFLFDQKDSEFTEKWFKKYGKASIFFSRMVPVFRTFISFPAGLAKMNISVFAILTFAGSLIWSGLLTWLGFALGENWEVLHLYFQKFDYLILILLVIGLIFWIDSRLRRRSAVKSIDMS